jgi:peptidoglycan-N-acetylglucosamine deacetylase
MVITTSWDDGDILDERVADMLDRHGLHGTFYVAQTHRPRRLSEADIRLLAARHEIGAHSLTHPNLTQLDRAEKTREIAGSKNWLEDVTGKPVAMFCYPLGQFDNETKEVVVKAGFHGGRTTGQFSVEPHRDRYAMRTTLQVHPALFRQSTIGDLICYLMEQRAARGSTALQLSTSMFRGWSRLANLLLADTARDDSHVFHLWGHSWEIEEHDMWRECDAFLRSIAELGAQARTNGEIC